MSYLPWKEELNKTKQAGGYTACGRLCRSILVCMGWRIFYVEMWIFMWSQKMASTKFSNLFKVATVCVNRVIITNFFVPFFLLWLIFVEYTPPAKLPPRCRNVSFVFSIFFCFRFLYLPSEIN